MKNPTVVLVGIGGYGNLYVNELLKLSAEGKCSFVAAVEPFPQSAPGYERLCDAGVKIYKTLGECYADFSPDYAAFPLPYSSTRDTHCTRSPTAAPYFVKNRFPQTGETPSLSQPKPKNGGCSKCRDISGRTATQFFR